LDFVKLNEFKDVKTALVTTNDLAAALTGNEKNHQFLSSYKNDEGKLFSSELAQLFRCASHLQCNSLKNIIGLYIAAQVYFEDNNDSYNSVKTRLNIN
jgi:hypothetical protein